MGFYQDASVSPTQTKELLIQLAKGCASINHPCKRSIISTIREPRCCQRTVMLTRIQPYYQAQAIICPCIALVLQYKTLQSCGTCLLSTHFFSVQLPLLNKNLGLVPFLCVPRISYIAGSQSTNHRPNLFAHSPGFSLILPPSSSQLSTCHALHDRSSCPRCCRPGLLRPCALCGT